jgi:hypothetical protein
MAPATRKSGLGSFIKQREALEAEQNRNTLDDLRVNVVEPDTPSRTKTVKQGSKGSRKRASSAENRNSQQTKENRVNDQHPFYDTDVSQAGIASTTPSLQQDSVQDRDMQQVDSEHRQLIAAPSTGSEHRRLDDDDSLDDSLREELGERGQVTISDRSNNAPFIEQTQVPGTKNRNALPYVDDGSYPATTSGQSSTNDTNDAFAGDTTHFHPGTDTRHSWNTSFATAPHAHHAANSLKPMTGTSQAQIVRPVHTTNLADIGADFQFVPAQKYGAAQNQLRPDQLKPMLNAPKAIHNAPPQHLRQQLQTSASPPIVIGRDRGQHNTLPSHRQRYPVQQEPERTSWNQPHSHLRQVSTPSIHTKTSISATERDTYDEPPGQGQHSQHFNADPTSSDEHLLQLDFPAKELLEMDFSTLAGQTFDIDPNVDVNRSLGDLAEKSLNEQLTAVAMQPSDIQADFFAGLDIDRWEESGEWFLDRFRDISRNLMQARREKRKAAQEFERSISTRHEEVSKKRKFTEDALKEMRKSGGELLRGSPQKLRKSK